MGFKDIGDSGWYEMLLGICWQIEVKNLNKVNEVNGFLRQFRRVIEGVKIQQGKINIRVENVDDFLSKKIDKHTLTCSNLVRICVIDESQNWASNKNTTVQPLIHNYFRALELHEKSFKIRVLDTCFQGESKGNHWPPDQVALTV